MKRLIIWKQYFCLLKVVEEGEKHQLFRILQNRTLLSDTTPELPVVGAIVPVRSKDPRCAPIRSEIQGKGVKMSRCKPALFHGNHILIPCCCFNIPPPKTGQIVRDFFFLLSQLIEIENNSAEKTGEVASLELHSCMWGSRIQMNTLSCFFQSKCDFKSLWNCICKNRIPKCQELQFQLNVGFL